VAGRALAFADPDIVRMAKVDYVPVTADDWYQRRRDDPEGQFFRKVADQGPRKGDGGSTRQGIYMFTSSGKLLAYKNAGQAPEVMREVLQQGLREWNKLPASERKPGAIQIENLPRQDPRYTRRPPPGGLIINVYTRILDRTGQNELCQGNCAVPGGNLAARDHLWLTEEEWKSLIPANPKKGARLPMPLPVARRIARFHLLDNTRGEPTLWTEDDIRSVDMTLTVEDASAVHLELGLNGSALLATDADPAKAKRGYEVKLFGFVAYNGLQKTIDRFDVVAVGDHWGEGTYTRGAREGRKPLGVAFALASKDAPSNQVPPQAAREIDEYFNKRK
jgi:hypothetical protein